MHSLSLGAALCAAAILSNVTFPARAELAAQPGEVPSVQAVDALPPLTKDQQACDWGKTSKARIAACTRVIRTEKDSHARAVALDYRGNERAGLGQTDLALADLDEAKRLWPQYGGPYVDRAMIFIDRRDIAGAMAEYEGLIGVDPDNDVGLDGRCWVRALANTELDAALSDCNRSIQLSPFNDIGYEDRAIVWLRRGEAERAFQDAAFALNQSSTNPRALYLRGLALMALGHTEEGQTDMAEAERANPPAVKFLVGWGLKP
jgi:tetratricopeptide (TPR) repeat protein